MKISFATREKQWAQDRADVVALYRTWHGRDLSLQNPLRYTEKIQWRKLYDHNPQFRIFNDKWAVRDYIARRVGEKYLVPIIWRGADPHDIPFAELTVPYVVKTSHASGQVMIVTKQTQDQWPEPVILQTLKNWLAESYGHGTVETGYRSVPRQILIEKLLLTREKKPPVERRCFVFHGKVRIINTVLVMDGQVRNGAFHTPNWERQYWHLGRPPLEMEFPVPKKLGMMIKIAELLGKHCDHLRVDFFDLGKEIFVGEITVYPWSGSAVFKPDEADFILGAWWNLHQARREAWRRKRRLVVRRAKDFLLRQRPMRIHLYAVAWNEEKILPFFLRHYAPWVDRFFIADDASDDGTAAILRTCKKQTSRPFAITGDSFVHSKQADGNDCWKQSRGEADWVIFCDMDEFLFHPKILSYLRWARDEGFTVLPAEGYQMVSETFPQSRERLTRTIRRGVPFAEMDKTVIFNPDAIEEIRYTPGHHFCSPTGRVVYPEMTELRLLHYKYLGLDYLCKRHHALLERRLPEDFAHRYGKQYYLTQEETRSVYRDVLQTATEIIPQK